MQQTQALPDWPRLMKAQMAADYLSVCPKTLHVLGIAPRVDRGPKLKLYDRRDLDQWVDSISGQPVETPAQQENEADRLERAFLSRRRSKNGGSKA